MGGRFVYLLFFGCLLYLLPVYVSVDGYADAKENKLWFALSPYRLPRLLSGYAQLCAGGIGLHLSRKKAVFLPFAQMSDTRKKFEIAKGFQLISLRQVIETGGAGDPHSVLLAALIGAAGDEFYSLIRTKHPFVRLRRHLLLVDGVQFKISLHAVFAFNGLVLTAAVGKKSLEVLLNWIKKRKSTVSWKRRRNS